MVDKEEGEERREERRVERVGGRWREGSEDDGGRRR